MNPLKSVMAAILAAFSVMSALPAAAGCYGAGCPKASPVPVLLGALEPATAPAQVKDENNAVNILTELISKDKKAQADVSARVQRLLLAPDFKGRSYVTPDLPKDPLAKTIPALVTQWVEEHPADAARLYFVARPLDGKVPEWVKKHPKGDAIFKDEDKALPERLGNYLAGTDQQHPAGSQVGTVAVSGMTNSLVKFLEGASTGAGVILDPTVPGTPDAAREAARRGDDPIKVPTGQPGGDPLDGSASGFDFNALYGTEGAVVANVYGPKDDGYRTLSIKMYTIPDGKGNFQNKIGIVDITDRDAPYGPAYVTWDRKETSFELRPGGRKYSLNVGEGNQLVIMRPDGEEGAVATSVEILAQKRLDQVASRGSVDIGGKQYYVLGQGGGKGSLVFFSQEEVDARKPPYDTEAKASAEVSEVVAGRTRPIRSKPGPDLGEIDGKPYHLKFDDKLKIWKVMPGQGYIPPVPKEPVAGKPGQPGKPGTQPETGDGEMKTLADVVAYLKTKGFEEPNPDGNAGFSDEMKQVVHILNNPTGDPSVCFILAPGIRAGNQWCPAEVDGDSLVGLRGFDIYGVVEYGNNKQYLSLPFFAGEEGAKISGSYGKGGMIEVKDVGIAIDILDTYEKFSEEKLTEIEARLNKHADGPYLISSNKAKEMILIRNIKEKKTYRVWPTEGEGSGDNAGMEDRKGPGTAVDLSFGNDAEFPPKMSADATQDMVRQKVSPDGGTAIYLLDDAETKEKKWFVMVRATIDKEPSRSGSIQIFGTGKDWNALPGSYTLKGYASTEVPRTAKMGLILGAGGKKGALALYKYTIPAKDGSNVKDKKGNCVGPLVWWGEGVDEAAAVKACRAGKF